MKAKTVTVISYIQNDAKKTDYEIETTVHKLPGMNNDDCIEFAEYSVLSDLSNDEFLLYSEIKN